MHSVLATTRFNNTTWEENCLWRRRNDWKGCVYGSPTLVNDRVLPGSPMFILEMNNERNQVVGVGLVANRIATDSRHKIYAWGNYNRYVYKSEYRIDREQLTGREETIMKIFDIILFTGLGHLKRGHGITKVPKRVTEVKGIDLEEEVRKMFTSRFKHSPQAVTSDAPTTTFSSSSTTEASS